MLEVQVVRELQLAGGGHLSAASALVHIGERLYVVADDELGLAVFGLSDEAPGHCLRLLPGELPIEPQARKRAKADFESLLELPPLRTCPHGALLAIGSGSHAARFRGALLPIDAAGAPEGPARPIDLAPWLLPLAAALGELNLEGAFVDGEELHLLQRGNKGRAFNARLTMAWPAVRAWLEGHGAAPACQHIERHELGDIDGVPLTFTDGAALPGAGPGAWAYSAAAEDTDDSYGDGHCTGSAVGIVDGQGRRLGCRRLGLRCKVEGLAATIHGDGSLQLLMVTDADDRGAPALLLQAQWKPPFDTATT